MSRITAIRRNIADYGTARDITTALADINILKMQSLRRQFEKSVPFYEGIRKLYGIVQAHRARTEARGAIKGSRGTELYVAIASNKRFYGSLNKDVVLALLEKAVGRDAVIIGEMGWEYGGAADMSRSKRLVFAGDVPTSREVHDLLAYAASYERVLVFYPKFVNPFRQDVAVTDIAEMPPLNEAVAEEVGHIFEPEMVEMLSFFNTEVRRILFERVILETELARSAARMREMRGAEENAGRLLKDERRRLRHETSLLSGMQLLEVFAGQKI